MLNVLVAELPKAELHIHIEGSLEPELMFELSQRNGVQLAYQSVDEIRQAYQFSNLQDFLNLYYQGMSVLQTEQDFFDLTHAYLQRIAEQNVRHTEIFFDPQGHTERGIPFTTAFKGISQALCQARDEFNISSHIIMCFLRHLSEESAFETLAQAEPFLDQIKGVGLDSSEVGHPPEKFKHVFAAARKHGLKIVAHAGEEGPPEYVWQALNDLQVDRIDHGNRALEDVNLVTELVAKQVPLTVCPLSNLKLCVVDDMTTHPLATMLEKGLCATVNSDDPAYFGGYINENFNSVIENLSLTKDQLVTLARNSFGAAFISEEQKRQYYLEIDKIAAKY